LKRPTYPSSIINTSLRRRTLHRRVAIRRIAAKLNLIIPLSPNRITTYFLHPYSLASNGMCPFPSLKDYLSAYSATTSTFPTQKKTKHMSLSQPFSLAKPSYFIQAFSPFFSSLHYYG
jgi:hypothetical protein